MKNKLKLLLVSVIAVLSLSTAAVYAENVKDAFVYDGELETMASKFAASTGGQVNGNSTYFYKTNNRVTAEWTNAYDEATGTYNTPSGREDDKFLRLKKTETSEKEFQSYMLTFNNNYQGGYSYGVTATQFDTMAEKNATPDMRVGGNGLTHLIGMRLAAAGGNPTDSWSLTYNYGSDGKLSIKMWTREGGTVTVSDVNFGTWYTVKAYEDYNKGKIIVELLETRTKKRLYYYEGNIDLTKWVASSCNINSWETRDSIDLSIANMSISHERIYVKNIDTTATNSESYNAAVSFVYDSTSIGTDVTKVTPMAIMVVYDKDGRMVDMDIAQTSLEPKTNGKNRGNEASVNLSLPKVEGGHAEVLVWKDYKNMMAYEDAVKIN